MSKEEDALFMRNLALVLAVLALIGILAFILAKVVNSHFQATQNTEKTVAARLAPVGSVNVSSEAIVVKTAATQPAEVDTASSAPATGSIGEQTYGKICFACHDTGVAGAPKKGDVQAWAGRLDKGIDGLVSNAINGYTGDTGMMPPKGGLTSISDEDIRAAVEYLIEGLNGEGSDTAPAAAEEPSAEASPVTPEPTIVDPSVARIDAEKGKEVYDAACFVCHTPGAAGAPKQGDTAAWAPRIEQGTEVLYEHAISGYMGNAGFMPPKGGRPDFSDDDVKAAVDYMVSSTQ